ncbi:hypothetical protein [Methylobacterium sp. Leaf88]|uniref:hypothetical protein n=1 Tax=Methylobacterium sp. Leaf88 TaxID=1736244 RepID=UPI0006F41CBC|nr:hypothetical protein [Methylobacterium sp. Leaf88]KQO76320.1 hypothetical protein ASF20_13270 [Methylobacterium sp. Leaf88]
MQHIAPTAPLNDFASTLLALNRTPAGLWVILLLSEIERLQRRGVAANLDMLVRGTGLSRTGVWGWIVEAESAGLLRARLIHQHRMVHKLTPAGHAALNEARTIVAALNGDDQGPVTITGGGTECQGGPVLSTGGNLQSLQGEVQNLHRGDQIDQGADQPQNTTQVRSRARPRDGQKLHVVGTA